MNLVIWLQIPSTGGGVNYLNPAIRVLKRIYGNVNVLGAVIDAPAGVNINGVRTLDRQDLKNLDYDIMLVAGNKASLVPVIQQAAELNIDVDKTVLDRTVCVPLFTMEKYNKLRHSKLSIFSRNCWAGFVYHRFGLPFLSPTINMFIVDKDFMKFLEDPIPKINKEPIFQGTKFEQNLHFDYPVFNIGGVEWNMNHYNDFDVALQKWNERKEKINWFNLLVVMSTESADILERFDELPFAKKVCYVPFESKLESAYSINLANYPNEPLWKIVNDSAEGAVINYDLWDMLLYGKKTPLQVMNR